MLTPNAPESTHPICRIPNPPHQEMVPLKPYAFRDKYMQSTIWRVRYKKIGKANRRKNSQAADQNQSGEPEGNGGIENESSKFSLPSFCNPCMLPHPFPLIYRPWDQNKNNQDISSKANDKLLYKRFK